MLWLARGRGVLQEVLGPIVGGNSAPAGHGVRGRGRDPVRPGCNLVMAEAVAGPGGAGAQQQ